MRSKKTKRKRLLWLRVLPEQMRHYLIRSRMRIPDLPDGLTFEIAKSRQDLDRAFSILYEAYHDIGITKSDPTGRRITKYHTLPTTMVLVAKYMDEVIATISIICDSYFGIPADKVGDFSSIRNSGKKLAELSSLALKKDFQGRSSAIHLYFSKYMFHCWYRYAKSNRAVLVVHPDRLDLYKGIFLFRTFRKKPVRNYSFVNNAPGVIGILNTDNFDVSLKRVYRGRPHNRNLHSFLFSPLSEKEERAMIFPETDAFGGIKPFIKVSLLEYYFYNGTNLIESLTRDEIEYLRNVYSHPEFNQIFKYPETVPGYMEEEPLMKNALTNFR